MSKLLFYALIPVLALSACNANNKTSGTATDSTTDSAYTEVKTGGIKLIPVVTDIGVFNVWTKKVGNGAIKVLLLHGGPGFGHEYLECFESFLPQEGIEFYYYDQLGSHYSDQPDDSTLWTLPRFVNEVEQVRKGLGLDNFYLYGHSWGGLLGMEYALKHQAHLKGLIISNMTAGIKEYTAYTGELKSKMPKEIIAKLDSFEKAGNYDAPEYQQIITEKLYNECICRLNPWPEPVTRIFKHANFKIYNFMQGANEFVVTGNLKDWSAWDRLHTIKTPTYVIGAKYDEMNPADMKRISDSIPNAKLLMCEKGSHMCMYDDQQAYFNGLIKFLKDVQENNFKK